MIRSKFPHLGRIGGFLGVIWLWFLVLMTLGCARALAPLAVIQDDTPCGPTDAACLLAGKRRFEAYRQDKLGEIRRKSGEYRLPAAPSAHLHPLRTDYAVLLIHGLNDSAYYMQDIASLLYAQGFNVLTLLLPGHGTDTRDMLEVTAEQWRAEVEEGLEMASMVGRKVVLGGFSLGGTLSIDAALRHPEIQGLLLFSPAIKLRSYNGLSSLSCAPGLRDLSVETDLPPNPVKYKVRFGNGVCQLARLIEHTLADAETGESASVTFDARLYEMGRRLHIPTFVALTYADARISPEAVLEWSARIDAPVTVVTFGHPELEAMPNFVHGGKPLHIDDENLPHSFLVRRSNPYNGQKNPYFDAMAARITRFCARNFPMPPVVPEL